MTRRAKKPAATVPWIVMVPFAVSGVIHLVRPGVFTPIIPRALRRWDGPLVIASGIAELWRARWGWSCRRRELPPGERARWYWLRSGPRTCR